MHCAPVFITIPTFASGSYVSSSAFMIYIDQYASSITPRINHSPFGDHLNWILFNGVININMTYSKCQDIYLHTFWRSLQTHVIVSVKVTEVFTNG